MSFWEGPLFTKSSVDEEYFSKLVDEDTAVYSKMLGLVALKSRRHVAFLLPRHLYCCCGLFPTAPI